MALAFDTLGYAKRLREAGIPQAQAEAHAEAAREFSMAELVTKTDLQTVVRQFETKLETQTPAHGPPRRMLVVAVGVLGALHPIIGS